MKKNSGALLTIVAILVLGAAAYAAIRATYETAPVETVSPTPTPITTSIKDTSSDSGVKNTGTSNTVSNTTKASNSNLTAEYAWQNQASLLNKTITIEDTISYELSCPDAPGTNSNALCTSRPVLGKLRTLNPTMTIGSNFYVGTSAKNPPYTQCTASVTTICDGWKDGGRYIVTGKMIRPGGVGNVYFDVDSREAVN